MRIVIDMQGAQSAGSKNRGIGRYTISFAKALISNKANHEIILLLNGSFVDATSSLQKEFSQILPIENIKVWYPIQDKKDEKISQAIQSNIINSLNPDFLIISSLFEGYIDNCIYSTDINPNIKTAIILYDLIPYIYKHIYLKDDNSYDWTIETIKISKKKGPLEVFERID